MRLLVLLSAPVLAAATPAQAGFFEDLFGIQEKPAAAPQPARPDPALAAKRAQQAHAAHEKSIANQIAANKALKAAQAGKDPAMLALQDNTLRRGDIVSGPNGLMVYMGGDPENPGEARFVPANDPRLEKGLRENLKGLKRPTAAVTPEPRPPEPQPQPQATEVAQQVSVERDGKVIRVIGAYQGGAD
ncbi:hypothetical protein M2323_002908 [Rhodoblastus acidophilus]|uniref:hypothetical protein n=1 Tax=Rhodoblastus acidophilus TaxID=1074 RepID=UPI0022253492|nr:hypothetical protein [Rhodoblastus acidophilus]MCW2284965.1 hypothetical protein [Rhodoblastus acidophilus]MCW2333971.1 hypothetical protein [Rhodoblastus acidophilus]